MIGGPESGPVRQLAWARSEVIADNFPHTLHLAFVAAANVGRKHLQRSPGVEIACNMIRGSNHFLQRGRS